MNHLLILAGTGPKQQESGDAFGFSTAINAAASSWPMSWQLLEVAQAIDAAYDVLLFTHATHTHGRMYSFQQILVILHMSVYI